MNSAKGSEKMRMHAARTHQHFIVHGNGGRSGWAKISARDVVGGRDNGRGSTLGGAIGDAVEIVVHAIPIPQLRLYSKTERKSEGALAGETEKRGLLDKSLGVVEERKRGA